MAPKLTTFQAYLESFIHDEHVIYGRSMLPFCLRHYTLLSGLKSPLLTGRIVTRSDLQTAVLICSTRTNEEFFNFAKAKKLSEKYWFFKTGGSHVGAGMKSFNYYIEDFLPIFPFWKNDKSAQERVPWLFVCAARVIDCEGVEKTMNMGIGQMIAWGMARMESEGKRIEGLMTEEEVQALKEIEELKHV